MTQNTFNFFQSQEESRRFSTLFGLSFIMVMILWSCLFYLVIRFWQIYLYDSRTPLDPKATIWSFDKRALIITGFFLLAIIILSLLQIRQIHQGGSTFIATKLGGTPLSPDGILGTRAGLECEKRLRNIIAEMSLAASISEPDLYILPAENGINAMAAGLTSDDAAVLVSYGALRYLDRDELSALIAHEFSHILNGDMRHFTIMAGWLHGLFWLQTTGRNLLLRVRNGRIILVVLAMVALGFLGTFMGRLLQAAFSRRREMLADASAVQFTRNSASLAGVLKKIGGLSQGSLIKSGSVPGLNHFFLAQPEKHTFFSSHPPLAERIWTLDPGWDGWYYDFDENPIDYLAEPVRSRAPSLKVRPIPVP
ncbi:MAG: M48 family metalloprotease [Deltaproteobacteria bacterium]|jgi:Zn-dependent protease with chaperone function|nr:M48 family metalloprotease [Deltaproteobacteria bacterium]